MATFLLQPNNTIYLYHWFTSTIPFKKTTKLKIDPDKWDKAKARAKSSKLNYNGKNINNELSRYERALFDTIEYFKVNRGFSREKFRSKFNEKLEGPKSIVKTLQEKGFLTYFESRVKSFTKNGDTKAKGYGTTFNHLKMFFGKKNPSFDDIDSVFYSSYNNYLHKEDLSKNTISNHWKHIKAIMKEAEKRKMHSNIDYKSFTRHKEDADTIYLTEKELDVIYNLKLKGIKAVVRDYFIIGCYTGLRYSDWDKLTNSKIKDGIASIKSDKTGIISTIPIHPRVKAILNTYWDGIPPKKLSSHKMNEYIRAIGLQAKINGNVDVSITKGGKRVNKTVPKYTLMASHTARRTFATLLVLKGVAPHIIMKITGHKTLSSFEKYVRFENLQASVELKDLDFFK